MASSDPESLIERGRASLRVLLGKGRRPDDLHSAIGIWKGLAPLMPDSVEPWAALGDLYLELRRFPEAKAALLTVAERYTAGRDAVGAETALRRIVQFDPTDLRVRSRLADLYAAQGRHHGVVEHHLAIAHGLAAAGHGPEAIEVLDRALRVAGEHPELRRQLDTLVHGRRAPPRGEESMSLPFFQLRDIFDEADLTAVLSQPTWAARYPRFAAEWTSPDALVRSRVVVPAAVVRAAARECRCDLVLYAGPDGVTLHLGGRRGGPEWFFHDSTGQLVSGAVPDTVLLATGQAFEEYGAHPVWLAVEYGSSYKGERYRMFHEAPAPAGREPDAFPASLRALWDAQSGREAPDLDRLVAAGRAASLDGVGGVEEHLAEWLARRFTPGGVDTASCFLTGYWPGRQAFHTGLVDRLTEGLERARFPPGVWASAVVALHCAFAAVDVRRRARIRKACAAVDPFIRTGRGWAVPAALDAVARAVDPLLPGA
jgi:hypothetical protein